MTGAQAVRRVVGSTLTMLSATGGLIVAYAMSEQPTVVRLGLVAAMGLVALAGLAVAYPPTTPFGPRPIVLGRRRGEVIQQADPAVGDPAVANLGRSSHTQPVDSPGKAGRVQFGIRRSGSWVMLGVTTVVAVWVVPAGFDGVAQGASLLAWSAALLTGPVVFLVVRSLVRLTLADRAVALDDAGATLGVALGYVPPLHLHRRDISDIVVTPTAGGALGVGPEIGFVVDQRRAFPIAWLDLNDPDGLLEWIHHNWPEVGFAELR